MPGTEGTGTHTIDVAEHGLPKDGAPQILDRRLFMQLFAWACPPELRPRKVARELGRALAKRGLGCVVYEDVNDPQGLALLAWSETPDDLCEKIRPVLAKKPLRKLVLKPEYTMLGRTYSSGFEPDLAYWILRRPRETVLNEAWPWAMWYPLRRTGGFARLPQKEQQAILREHAAIGRAYGEQDLAHDIRLACFGLDKNDNEFVIGLIGKELYPLSHVVQAMRKTRQTSEFIVQMGPFFLGRAVFRAAEPEPKAAEADDDEERPRAGGDADRQGDDATD
jgi:chlorite dismutase